MRRSVWFAAGAGAGVYASVRARRIAQAFTSDGISDRMAALRLGGRLLREDITAGAVEKEAELRDRISGGFVTALRASSTSESLRASSTSESLRASSTPASTAALPPGNSQEKELS